MDANRRTIIWIIIIIIIILIIVFVLVFIFGKGHTTQALTSTVTGCATLDPPNNISITQNDNETITITWTAVPNASRYKAFVGTSTGFSEAAALTTEITDTNQAIISGLTLGNTYFAFVETLNACNTASIKSNEASIFMNFPAQFKIANRSSPFFTMAVDGTNVDLETDCQGTSNLCLFTYDSNNLAIKSVFNPTLCVVSFPDFPNADRLELKPCASIFPSNASIGQWQYDQTLGALCHFPPGTNTTATSCAKLSGGFSNNTPIRIANYDSSAQVIWDVLPV